MIYYLIASILIAVTALFARTKRAVLAAGILFYAVQIAAAGLLLWGGLYDTTSAAFFTFDALGTLFYLLLVVVSMYVFGHSEAYLQGEDLRSYRLYFALLMLLTTAIAGAYFANNLAVTWIFLEATTLCSAGIIYHRRTAQALEAAWKYVFVCSTGIAMAYLGILLLAAATKCETLSYEAVAEAASSGNPLYLKTAFLLILSGYSCKLELFPLYTVGIDANFAAPAPASALISTGLVNAGFLALLRVYKLLAGTEVFPWVRSVLLIVGILSLGVGALFLRRTNNYKRFLSYSTVENMGIAAIGLGIGGIGVWAALFHVFCHTLIKSSLFLQMAVVRQVYDSYRINRGFDCSATCSRVGYDAQTRTVRFLISITSFDGQDIEGDKLTFSLGRLLTGKTETEGAVAGLDLTAAQAEPATQRAAIRGLGGPSADVLRSKIDGSYTADMLVPTGTLAAPAPGVTVTAMGYIDGLLHIQVLYENIHETDNHGQLWLENGAEKLECLGSLSFFDENESDSFEEYVFDVSPVQLADCTLYGSFVTADTLIEGGWEITFPLTEAG